MSAVRAEWIKFRTVRGWLIALVIAALLCEVFTFLVAHGVHSGTCTGSGTNCQSGHPFVPARPDGEAIADSYQYDQQTLMGNGTITARVSSLTGLVSTTPANVAPSMSATRPALAPWAKAGLLLTSGSQPGAPYAAVMATGRHGVRFQYDYTHDQAAQPGAARWLRLTRTGDTITGYKSANGTSWHKIGAARLPGLRATIDAGLFVTSPVSFQGTTGYPTQATGTFSHVTVTGITSGTWQSRSVGMSQAGFYPTLGAGTSDHSSGTFVLTGSGDIAPAVVQGLLGTNTAASTLLLGLIATLIVLIVISALYITAEYRRGLIRTTLAAIPQRGQVLGAKAIVIGAAGLVTGVVASAVAVPLGDHFLAGNGAYVFPATGVTDTRIIIGCGIITGLTAVAVLALGVMLRRSAGAVTAGIVVFVLPYIIGSALPGGAETWLFRLTPAAAFSVLSALPRSSVVSYPYTFANGYYPLSPWAGLAVLAVWTAVALGAGRWLLERRDA
ncbi:MAG TPA: ABC transporter permease subunit [Streptosporangiaceae bacterium]|nr:ABC transporter permease subunit [Streptosporangiaceae bacterium]